MPIKSIAYIDGIKEESHAEAQRRRGKRKRGRAMSYLF
jgi:hypothetical protein